MNQVNLGFPEKLPSGIKVLKPDYLPQVQTARFVY